MKNIVKPVGTWGLGLYVIAMVLTAGMTVGGCSNGSTDPGTDPALNGTWVDGPYGMRFNNGNFESTVDDIPQFKGTYITGNGTLTMTVMHVYGEYIDEDLEVLEARWYTKAQLRSALIDADVSEEDVEEIIGENYLIRTGAYSVNGNTLTVDDDTFTRT